MIQKDDIEFRKQSAIVEEKFRAMESLNLTENGRVIVKEVRSNFEETKKLSLEIFDIRNPTGDPGAAELMEEMDYKHVQPGAEKITRLFDMIKEKREKANIAAEKALEMIASIIDIGVLSAFILSLVIAALITRSISKPIKTLTEAAHKIGSRDLDANVKITSKDEVGILATAFNTMASDLRQSLEEQRRLYGRVSPSASTMPLQTLVSRACLQAIHSSEPSSLYRFLLGMKS